jgi:hypothetical protein
LSAKRALLRKGKTQAGFWDANGGGICWFFSARPFFQPFVFAGLFFGGSGRQCQFLFLFQSRQHPQVVRQDLLW